MTDEDESLIPSACEEIVNHLEILSKSFDGYFGGGELEISEEWIINPYSFNLDYMPGWWKVERRSYWIAHKSCSWNGVWKQNSGTILVNGNGHVSKTLWKSTKYAHPIRDDLLVRVWI